MRHSSKPPDQTNQILSKIKEILRKDNLTNAEQLKAIEIWAKILMIRHKISDTDKEGSFFER